MTESTVTQRLSLNELTVLRRAGLNDEHVHAVSRVIVAGERDGAKAHGIHRLETCLSSLRARKVVPDAPVTIEDGKS
jgi:LDH2 family malate/lactate/ureidoglycolate dehydrogenase